MRTLEDMVFLLEGARLAFAAPIILCRTIVGRGHSGSGKMSVGRKRVKVIELDRGGRK